MEVFTRLPRWLSGKESACNAGDTCSIPGSGRSPGEGHGNPFQYSCLENPWTEEPGGLQSSGVAKSQTQLMRLGMHGGFHRHAPITGFPHHCSTEI